MNTLHNKKVCILHPGNPKFDLRLKKTVKMLADAGADVYVLAYLSLPQNDIAHWEDCTSLCRPRPYTNIKASENKIWLLRVAWNLTVIKTQEFFDRGVGCCGGLGKIAAELDVDWYHCINIETAEEIISLARLTQKPIVYEAYEHFAALLKNNAYYSTHSENKKALELERTIVTKIANRTIVVGKEIAEEYVAMYGCPTPAVVHNVAPNHLEAPAEHRDDLCKFYFQSYLRPTYNIEAIIEAFSKTQGGHLTIQGDSFEPEYLEALKRTISQVGNDKISLLSACGPEAVVDAASQHDVGLIPISSHIAGKHDRSAELALPNKLFAYASAGLAIAASDFPAQRRFIDQYQCGVFFDPTDVSDISRSMQWCIDHPQEILKMRANAIELGIDYSFEHESKHFADIVHDMLEGVDYGS